ncbi:MAG: hut operon positive regulator HutP [Firmicutes bacterium]|nr:hut operon positive regulator HutP [Bacillota bacterium]
MKELESLEIARAAIRMATTRDRAQELQVKEELRAEGIRGAAIDIGGEFSVIVKTGIERALVAAKREGLIQETHTDEGAVAGAAREALSQVVQKAFGLNVGGKIGVARKAEHLIVVAFFAVGLVHLNEVAIGLGHRAIPMPRS